MGEALECLGGDFGSRQTFPDQGTGVIAVDQGDATTATTRCSDKLCD